MTQFVKDLWESIFTAGPTPSLLLATNATFAALQVVLAALLIATHSIHFVVLSVLCAGLWYAIDWFARELLANQNQELKEHARAARMTAAQASFEKTESKKDVKTFLTSTQIKSQPEAGARKEVDIQGPSAAELKQRVPPASQGSKSSVSTEDEWEKVSQHESDKTR